MHRDEYLCILYASGGGVIISELAKIKTCINNAGF